MRYLKERATRRRDRGFRREQIHQRGEVTLVSDEDDKTETNRMNSSATCAQSLLFLPFVHGSLSCPALKLISVCLCRVQKSQAILAQNHTRTHSLALNPRLLFRGLELQGNLWEGTPAWKRGGGTRTAVFC